MEDTGDIVFAIITLAVALATDYMYTHNMIWISSAIPIFVFQLIMIGNKKLKAKRGGKGIIACIGEYLCKKNETNNSE